jgi:hypothetical protein
MVGAEVEKGECRHLRVGVFVEPRERVSAVLDAGLKSPRPKGLQTQERVGEASRPAIAAALGLRERARSVLSGERPLSAVEMRERAPHVKGGA